jgi:hypothetical protein
MADGGETLGEDSHEVAGDDMVEQLPDWERLLRAAARLQGILPDATLVGGTAAAIAAGHRRSMDADHVIAGLMGRFDEVLAELESAAGWKTNRVKRPVAIYGSLDGILTTVRNQIRSAPLDTVVVTTGSQQIRVPTRAEILRVKAWLIVSRNATRDFLDVSAIASTMSDTALLAALAPLDKLYPQTGDPGAVRHQLMRQLAMPRPFDLESLNLTEYKGLSPVWHDWATVRAQCQRIGTLMAKAVSTQRTGWKDVKSASKK